MPFHSMCTLGTAHVHMRNSSILFLYIRHYSIIKNNIVLLVHHFNSVPENIENSTPLGLTDQVKYYKLSLCYLLPNKYIKSLFILLAFSLLTIVSRPCKHFVMSLLSTNRKNNTLIICYQHKVL